MRRSEVQKVWTIASLRTWISPHECVTGTGSLDILKSGHGYFGNLHPLQIFLNPY